MTLLTQQESRICSLEGVCLYQFGKYFECSLLVSTAHQHVRSDRWIDHPDRRLMQFLRQN